VERENTYLTKNKTKRAREKTIEGPAVQERTWIKRGGIPERKRESPGLPKVGGDNKQSLGLMVKN